MMCERCSGLMTVDRYIDGDSQDSRSPWMALWRCLICGNVVDPQIRMNRLLQHSLREHGARIRSERAWSRQVVRGLQVRSLGGRR